MDYKTSAFFTMKHLFKFLLFFSIQVGIAQTPSLQKSPFLTEASPASVGMSADRLARIDSMCNEAIDESIVPGMVTLVARKGKIVYHKAFGMANNATGKAMEKDAIFRIASQTKAITSTAIMMLWEEGKFSLNDPISMYIPEFKNAQVLDTLHADGTYETTPANQPITIRHLLTHTSGIGYGEIDGDERFKKIYRKAGITDLFTTENVSLEENIKKLAQLPLHHQPGERFTYGENNDVLGYLVQILSGVTLDQFLKTRIFDPLNMNDTYFYLPKKKQSRLVTIQKKEKDKWVNYPVTFYDPDYPVKGAKNYFSGGAGLSSTARDYATFLQMYLNNGEINGVRILSRTTVQFMMANQFDNVWNDAEAYYALAFQVLTEKGAAKGGKGSAGTFEWGGYFNTQYFADPEEKLIGIIMKQTQGVYPDPTGDRFRQIVLQAIDD